MISGLWHGANWTYILWGAINGFYLVFAIITKSWRERFNQLIGLNRFPKLNNALQIGTTFFLVCFAWIFFRANNTQDAFLIIRKIFSMSGTLFIDWQMIMLYAIGGILFLFSVEFKNEYYKGSFSFMNHPVAVVRYGTYTFLCITILLIGVFDGGQFIYFQF